MQCKIHVSLISSSSFTRFSDAIDIPGENIAGAIQTIPFVPEGFNIAHTENHWSNEAKCLEMIDKIILPSEKSGVASHS